MAVMAEQFRASVERLSAPAHEQQAYLERLGTAPSADELGLEFDDAYAAIRPTLPERLADVAARLDRYLASLSDDENTELWTVAALASAPEWQRVRELAKELLSAMNEEQ